MSMRDEQVLLRDMLTASQRAVAEIQGRDVYELASDHVRTLGLVKCLEIIGEAANRLGSDFHSRHETIPWKQIIGMRNRLIHAYFDIDHEQIWKTLTEDLPPLIEAIAAILSDEYGDRLE